MSTWVFIVDDDAAVRDSLTMLLEAAGHSVAAFPSARDFLAVCSADCAVCRFRDASTPAISGAKNQCAGCLILDVSMPGMDGPALQLELLQRGILMPILFLSAHGSIPTTVRTIKSGAMDFLTKPVDMTILLARVQDALQRSVQIKKEAEDHQTIVSRLATLSQREREVMMLAIEGHTSKEIAQRLAISYRTVELHRTRVMQKTGAGNLLELAHIARLSIPHSGSHADRRAISRENN